MMDPFMNDERPVIQIDDTMTGEEHGGSKNAEGMIHSDGPSTRSAIHFNDTIC